MAKDYAKRANKRVKNPPSQTRAASFKWFSLLKGIFFISLLAMSVLYLSQQIGKPFARWLFPGHNTKELAASTQEQQAKFEFYSLLQKGMAEQNTKEKSVLNNKPKNQLSAKPNDPLEMGQYLLQVASFRKAKDADRLKAELTLKGFDVVVSPFVNENRTWYRVKVGPFKSLSAVKTARLDLNPMGLNGLIQRVG